MKKVKFFTVFICLLCLILPCFAFMGCNAMFEKAICKIGKTKYNSLAEAIVACDAGDTIYIYNDVKEDFTNKVFQENGFKVAQNSENVYVNYIIDKAINITGVKQNRKKPKIFGSFITNLANSEQINYSINISNIEIINDYISLTDDNLNQPFTNAIQIKNGNANINDCDIHPYKQIDNATLQENNITCLNGIILTREDNEVLNNVKMTYEIKNNQIYDYSNYTTNSYSSAFSIIENAPGYRALAPYSINNTETEFVRDLTEFNQINKNNSTKLQIFNFLTQNYGYLSTLNSNLIKEENFYKDSIVDFYGQDFGYSEKTTFNVYGQMYFVNLHDIHFVMKTSSAKVANSGTRRNVTVKVFMDLPDEL